MQIMQFLHEKKKQYCVAGRVFQFQNKQFSKQKNLINSTIINICKKYGKQSNEILSNKIYAYQIYVTSLLFRENQSLKTFTRNHLYLITRNYFNLPQSFTQSDKNLIRL